MIYVTPPLCDLENVERDSELQKLISASVLMASGRGSLGRRLLTGLCSSSWQRRSSGRKILDLESRNISNAKESKMLPGKVEQKRLHHLFNWKVGFRFVFLSMDNLVVKTFLPKELPTVMSVEWTSKIRALKGFLIVWLLIRNIKENREI